MATGTLRDFTLQFFGAGNVFLSTAESPVSVRLTSTQRNLLGGVFNANDNLVWARTPISMAVATTGSDLDANAVVDYDTGVTQNFATWAAAIVVNMTTDPTARIKLEGGSANPVLFPAAGWAQYAYGFDSQGRNFPSIVVNPNFTGTFSSPITNSTGDKYRLVSNTPATATLLVGDLILIGTST